MPFSFSSLRITNHLTRNSNSEKKTFQMNLLFIVSFVVVFVPLSLVMVRSSSFFILKKNIFILGTATS